MFCYCWGRNRTVLLFAVSTHEIHYKNQILQGLISFGLIWLFGNRIWFFHLEAISKINF